MTPAIGSRPAVLRRSLLAAAIAAIGLAGAARAYADPDPVDLKVVDRETGQPLKVWRHDGRLFVAGQPGARYAVRVTNHTDGRVLVVMSVDGVNVLSGQTAGYNQRGYVLGPRGSYDVNGWRKSTTEVAAFVFAPLPQSYAAKTGRPADVGVIGIAVFPERVVAPLPVTAPPQADLGRRRGVIYGGADPAAGAPLPPPPPPPPPPPAPASAPAVAQVIVPAYRNASPPPSRAAAVDAPRPAEAAPPPVQDKLGTAHGAREWSVSNIVPFERASPNPVSVRQIEYDTYDNLVARGVIPTGWPWGHRPQPFPAKPGAAGYVPDPPN